MSDNTLRFVDGDVVAERHPDGSYAIHRWSARTGTFVAIPQCRGDFETIAMFKALDALRGTGHTYIRNVSGDLLLVDPTD